MDTSGNVFAVDTVSTKNPQKKTFKKRKDNWNKWREQEFFDTFRLTQPTVSIILAGLASSHCFLLYTPVNLRFYASSSIAVTVADGNSWINRDKDNQGASTAIASKLLNYIKLPTKREECEKVCKEF